MSESLSDAVREAAGKEAEREFAHVEFSMTYPIAFMRGAVWVAERLPTEAELTNAILGRTAPTAAKTVLALIREQVTAT